jgi:DNA-binding beta-propeller fold protein YncE
MANQLYYPGGMFIDVNTSTIWIADSGNNRIVRWNSSLTAVVVCGSAGVGPNQFDNPYGLFVDLSASNTLYVADTFNHRIQMWLSAAQNGITVAGQTDVCGSQLNQLCGPTSVIMDQSGNIYIVDSANNRIMRWTIGSTSGMMVAGDSTYGVLPNQLNNPWNIKLDPSGALIVVDTYNNRIQMFSVSCSKYKIFDYFILRCVLVILLNIIKIFLLTFC